MNIASHNTFTYLKPKNWWVRPFAFIAKCQEVSLSEQWMLGVRNFDLRVRFDEDETPYICHGLVRYKGDVTTLLMELNELAQKDNTTATCRVMLEDNIFVEDRGKQMVMFKKFCKYLDRQYCFFNINFYGGFTKVEWKNAIVYDFDFDIALLEKHASVSGKFLCRICPRLYARLHNLSNRGVFCGQKDYVFMFDYVNL